jgi:hypothetical protein
MRLYLVNPDNPVVSLNKVHWNRLNKYRVWKPLGLLVVAGLTPPDWEVTLIDENLGHPDYGRLPKPDLVGVTAFTSQAPRAYEVAALYRATGVPVVMGGIHATFCRHEALEHVDAVVTGEAESVWGQVLADARNHALRMVYDGGISAMDAIPPARHDLLHGRYYFGSVQTTRGCPLNCSFCSVTAFNGGTYRHRPVDDVIRELRLIREKVILFVDDNLIGTREDHLAYSKDLFRAMIQEGLTRPWICQATMNFADDDELLELAARSGCQGVFIGFESPTVEGLMALGKKFNLQKGRDFRESVRRIQRHMRCGFFHHRDRHGPARDWRDNRSRGQGIRHRRRQPSDSYSASRNQALRSNGARRQDPVERLPTGLEVLHSDLSGGQLRAPYLGGTGGGGKPVQRSVLLVCADSSADAAARRENAQSQNVIGRPGCQPELTIQPPS